MSFMIYSQIRVIARDQATPQQTGTATVAVTVERNTFSPVFIDPGTYRATIAETYPIGRPIITVSAKDEDPKVSGKSY